jgi:hypothetical protein
MCLSKRTTFIETIYWNLTNHMIQAIVYPSKTLSL